MAVFLPLAEFTQFYGRRAVAVTRESRGQWFSRFRFCQPVPLMVPVRPGLGQQSNSYDLAAEPMALHSQGFNLLFIAINAYHIGKILVHRQDLSFRTRYALRVKRPVPSQRVQRYAKFLEPRAEDATSS